MTTLAYRASQMGLFPGRQSDTDPCARKHGGQPTSVAAHQRVQKEADRERVLAYVKAQGLTGATLDEVSAAFDVAPNRISGRFSELRWQGRLRKTDAVRLTRTRSPAAVYVVD